MGADRLSGESMNGVDATSRYFLKGVGAQMLSTLKDKGEATSTSIYRAPGSVEACEEIMATPRSHVLLNS